MSLADPGSFPFGVVLDRLRAGLREPERGKRRLICATRVNTPAYFFAAAGSGSNQMYW
jgi:hypothetical protein